jgi:cytidylate kinase
VERVARDLGVSEAEAEAHDEWVDKPEPPIFTTLRAIPAPAAVSLPVRVTTDSPVYHEARRRVVEEAMAAGQAVIVGRGAQVLLAGRRDVLHGRVAAPLESRIAYVMRREGLGRVAAMATYP